MEHIGGPIYCQFLDREMAESVSFPQATATTLLLLRDAIMASEGGAYCSLSALGENLVLQRLPGEILDGVLRSGQLETVSDVPSGEEFLWTRRQLYRDDKERYPAYFEQAPRELADELWAPSFVKASSSTEALDRSLRQSGSFTSLGAEAGVFAPQDYVERAEEILDDRDGRAITYALFRDMFGASSLDGPVGPMVVRRAISAAYGRHLVEVRAGNVLTGIPRLQIYDRHLAFESSGIGIPRRLVELLLAPLVRLNARLKHGDVSAWSDLVSFREGPSGAEFAYCVASVVRHVVSEPDRWGEASVEMRALRLGRELLKSFRNGDNLQDHVLLLADAVRSSDGRGPRRASTSRSSKVLICYVNDNEYEGILDGLSIPRDALPEVDLNGRVSIQPVGRHAGADLFMVQSEAGSVGASAAQLVTVDAIDAVKPDFVVAVGIAFGLKYKIAPGTVLVSTMARSYERVRMGSRADGSLELRERDQPQPVDAVLLNQVRLVAKRNQIPVAFGEMLSGEKLVDHPEFRASLIERFPDAIGGEMEATGIAGAAARRRVPWLMFKGLSDYGDGKKKSSERSGVVPLVSQREAAANGARLLLSHLQTRSRSAQEPQASIERISE